MVQGISQKVGQGLSPGLEFLPGLCIPGYKVFIHPVGAHSPPLVVIPSQPDLGNVREVRVLGYLPGDEVAVVIKDGHVRGVLVVQPAGGLGSQ